MRKFVLNGAMPTLAVGMLQLPDFADMPTAAVGMAPTFRNGNYIVPAVVLKTWAVWEICDTVGRGDLGIRDV